MPILTTIDRDLMTELADEPLLLAPHSQYPDMEQLRKLMGYGWVAPVYYRQGGTIYRLTALGQSVLEGEG